jgi:hypothetical protein
MLPSHVGGSPPDQTVNSDSARHASIASKADMNSISCAPAPRAYNIPMADKRSIEDKIDTLSKLVEAIAEDVTGIDERLDSLATKEQMIALHTQVNSIETELRDMKHTKLHARVADLEENVFGAAGSRVDQ